MNNTTNSSVSRTLCADFLDFMPSEKTIRQENEKEIVGIIIFARVISLCITIVGVVGNTVTIYKITRELRFHRPVFILLRCLAISDFFSLVANYLLIFTNLQSIIGNCTTILHVIPSDIFDILLYWSQHCSCFHIVLLAGYRCYLFVSPLRCQQGITNKKIVIASILVWIVSLTIAITFAISGLLSKEYSTINIVYSGYVFSVPLSLILTFHIKKIRHAPVQHEAFPRSSVKFLSNSLKRRLNIVFVIVLTLFGVPCVFQIAYFTLSLLIELGITSKTLLLWNNRMRRASAIAWLFNYAVHPIVYFFNSKQVRRVMCP